MPNRLCKQGAWNGKLVCDDFGGYKASFQQGITEIGCMAHARRKFFDLHATNKSQLAEQTLHSIGGLYEFERQAREMADEDRWRICQEKAVPLIDVLHTWMMAKRDLVPEGAAIAKALDYSLKRWAVLTRYVEDGTVPIDNNAVENQIRPWTHGRSNWLFAGSLRSGKRAAAIMSLVQSARMNGHDPYAYLPRCADAVADAAGKRYRPTAAASVEARLTSADAYDGPPIEWELLAAICPDVDAVIRSVEVNRKGLVVQNWYGETELLLQAFVSKNLVVNRSNPSAGRRRSGGIAGRFLRTLGI